MIYHSGNLIGRRPISTSRYTPMSLCMRTVDLIDFVDKWTESNMFLDDPVSEVHANLRL